MRYRHFRAKAAVGLTGAAVAAVSLVGVASPSMASSTGVMQAAAVPAGPPQVTPAAGTPQLNPTGTKLEGVRQLVQCGNTMYAVGYFTSIKRYSTVYARNNIFSFSATAPYKVTAFNPNVNGEVNSIAFNGGNCADAYIGGKFTTVNGTAVRNIAEVNTSTGAVVTSFGHNANGQVETLISYNNHIIVGGYYKSINNSSANPYMTSLNATTGKDDGFIHLNISGNYQYAGVSSNPTRVYNQEVSNSGTLDLVMGDFTSVGGLPRQQIFMLNLATSPATVTGWTSPEWDGSNPAYHYQCAPVEPFYLQSAAWSPDDSTIYVATTGYKPNGTSTSVPRSGLCDAAAAFPSTQTSVTHKWINYTGCDSLYAAAADGNDAYFAGHERWSMNPSGCDHLGPGAIASPGIEATNPSTGALLTTTVTNANGTTTTKAIYTRSRGTGADDMLVTPEGLWIASDNGTVKNGALLESDMCDGVYNKAGICLLPYN